MATTSGSFVCLRANFRRRVRNKSNVLKLSTEQPVRARNVGQTCRNSKSQVVRSRRAPGILTKITVREARASYNQKDRKSTRLNSSHITRSRNDRTSSWKCFARCPVLKVRSLKQFRAFVHPAHFGNYLISSDQLEMCGRMLFASIRIMFANSKIDILQTCFNIAPISFVLVVTRSSFPDRYFREDSRSTP